MKKRISILSITFLFINILNAQEINIRSVPLVSANQEDFQPSLSRGMGNLSIVFDDSIADPFINPAKASKLSGLKLFFSPTRNTWSNKEGTSVNSNFGSAKYRGTKINSLPFGFYLRKDNVFAGGSIAYQSYSSDRSSTIYPYFYSPSNYNDKNDIGNNTYLFGLIGTYLPDLKVSVAGSFSWSKYSAFDGVNLLYPGSYEINQDGWAVNYKLGLLVELSDKEQLDLIFGRSMFKSTHDVIYNYGGVIYDYIYPYREDLNKDESNGWIVHTKYNRVLIHSWKFGAMFTINWKEHPKLPNYTIANIPRDPGNSTAYNIGAGLVHYGSKSIAGFEYIYEPISSNTWAEPDELSLYPKTYRTVENFFDFYNHILRAGILSQTEYNWLDIRFGIQLHFYKYNLKQNDNIAFTSRSAEEDWLETSLTGGLTFKLDKFQIFYSLQLILGNGIVETTGSNSSIRFVGAEKAVNDFLIAPSSSLTVDKIPLVSQQITFMYNL